MKITALAIAAVAGVASAQPTFFAFQDDTLFRGGVNGGGVQSFTLSETIIAAEFDGSGDLFAHSSPFSPNGSQGYRVDNAFGAAPSLSLSGSGLQNPGPSSIAFIGNQAFGFNTQGDFVEYDPNTLAEINVIAAQQLGVGGNGLGYDAVNDVLYMVDRNNDALFTVDYTTGDITTVGDLGVDIQNAGATFFDGQLWAAFQNNSTGNLEVGTIDVNSGALSSAFTLAGFPTGTPATVAFAVIPAPGSIAVLGLAGLAASRRRR
ncbi:MAG: hypothetical protein AAF297_07625 [Planctomycetota bacterium]